MEKQEIKYYSNMKMYNRKMQRLAIFARRIDDNLEVFILRCSKKDNFNRALARQAYNLYIAMQSSPIVSKKSAIVSLIGFNPELIIVPLMQDGPQYSFNMYCKNNFYKRMPVIRNFVEETLFDGMGNRVTTKSFNKTLFNQSPTLNKIFYRKKL